MSGWRSQRSSQSIWLYAAIGLLIVFVGVAFLGQLAGGGGNGDDPGESPTATAPPNSVAITIASSNTKEAWLHQAVDAFNQAAPGTAAFQVGGKPVFVSVLQEQIDGRPVDYRSGTMVSDTLSGKIEPTVLSPGEESWIAKLEREWSAIKGGDPIGGDQPVVVRTPLVIAMWQSRARALDCWPEPGAGCTWAALRDLSTSPDGWGSVEHPEWRNFRFGYGFFGESNSGTLAVISMCSVGLAKGEALTVADIEPTNACGQFISDIERAKVHSGKSDVWLLDKMTGGGPEYLDAVVTYESNVIARNRTGAGTLREPLVSVYPQDGTIVVGHPYAILDGAPWVTPEQAEAAVVFRDFLLSGEQQQKVLELGLRPADPAVSIGSPIDPSFGANPDANLVALAVPETLVIDRIGEVWHRIRKHAVIAIVFDKSGSMSGTKITAAVRGAQAFVNRMDGEDRLLWVPFDDQIYPGATGRKADVGEQLVGEIGGTAAAGGTALYDAVLYAYGELTSLRTAEGDVNRYGIVVLSDGQDQNSAQTLAQLEAALQPAEGDPAGIQIHTIAIGEDADENVLKKVAGAAHGRYWRAETESQVTVVYTDIAAYF